MLKASRELPGPNDFLGISGSKYKSSVLSSQNAATSVRGRHSSSQNKQDLFNQCVFSTPLIHSEQLMFSEHPTLNMSRLTSNDLVRQNINVHSDYARDIESYLKERETLA